MIVEPIAGNMNMIVPARISRHLACRVYRAWRCANFDEVMTGLGLAYGQRKPIFITPDLTTFGKIIGAGLPVQGVWW